MKVTYAMLRCANGTEVSIQFKEPCVVEVALLKLRNEALDRIKDQSHDD